MIMDSARSFCGAGTTLKQLVDIDLAGRKMKRKTAEEIE